MGHARLMLRTDYPCSVFVTRPSSHLKLVFQLQISLYFCGNQSGETELLFTLMIRKRVSGIVFHRLV